MAASRPTFSPEVLAVYDSLLLADYAIMRHNDPVFSHVAGPDRIYLVVSGRDAGRAGGHNPTRLMDPAVTAHALIRGLFWAVRGFEWYRDTLGDPLSCDDLARASEAVLRSLGCTNTPGSNPGEALASVAQCLWDKGLLHLIPCKPGERRGDVMPIRAIRNPSLAEPSDHLALQRLEADAQKRFKCKDWSYRKLVEALSQKLARLAGLYETPRGVEPCLKTLHGLVIRDTANSRSLPDRYVIADSTLLPILIEPREDASKHSHGGGAGLLPKQLKEYLKRGCPGRGDSLAEALESALRKTGVTSFNRYQALFLERYFSRRLQGGKPWGLLTAPTGSGKTLAFSVVALTELLAGKCRGGKPLTVLAYPRKTLERQQLASIAEILYHLNDELAARGLGKLKLRMMVRDGSSPRHEELTGRRASHRIKIPNTRASWTHTVEEHSGFFIYKSDPDWLIDVKESKPLLDGSGSHIWEAPDIIITNYSMLYKLFVIDHPSSTADGAKLAERIARDLRVLILDEAHLLAGEEIYTLQAPLLLISRSNNSFTLILSSATLTTLDLLPTGVSTTHVLGVIPCVTPASRKPETVVEQITGLPLGERPVYVDYYKEYSCPSAKDSSRTSKLVVHKKTVWAVMSPSTERSPLTAVLEAAVAALHALAPLRGRVDAPYKSIVFVDVKKSLKDLIGHVTKRIILESGDVYDRVLLTKLFTPPGNSSGRRKAEKLVWHWLEGLLGKGCTLLNAVWDLCVPGDAHLADYHNLTAYLDWRAYQAMAGVRSPNNAILVIQNTIKRHTAWIPGRGSLWLDTLLQQARELLDTRGWEGDHATRNYLNRWSGPHLLIHHHGDIIEERHRLDQILEGDASPLLVLATSTLEVGLNIEGVIYTMHYRLPASNARIVQEVGRSGRRSDTLLTSLGIAFPRHNAWETPKRIEEHAVDYFMNVKVPEASRLIDNPLALAQLAATTRLRPTDLAGDSKPASMAEYILDMREDIMSIIKNSAGNSRRRDDSPIVSRLLSLTSELSKLVHDITGSSEAHRLAKSLQARMRVISRGRNNGLTPLERFRVCIAADTLLWRLEQLLDRELARLPSHQRSPIIKAFDSLAKKLRDALREVAASSLYDASLLTGVDPKKLAESLIQPTTLEELGFKPRRPPVGVTFIGEPL